MARIDELLREIGRNISSGMTRFGLLSFTFMALSLCTIGLDVAQIISLESTVAAYLGSRSDIELISKEKAINAVSCQQIMSSESIVHAGAIREATPVILRGLPDNRIPTFEVSDGLLSVIDASQADHAGVWASRTLADKMQFVTGSIVETQTGSLRISGIYDWPEDGRDARLEYAILVPVPASGRFDECWASVWPATDVQELLRSTVTYEDGASGSHLGKVNYTNGDTLDANDLFISRLTHWTGLAGFLISAIIAFMSVRRRKLEIAGNMHAGLSKSMMLIQNELEFCLPMLVGCTIAYGAMLIGLRIFQTPDCADIALLSGMNMLWIPVGCTTGIYIASLSIREKDLFMHFKAR